MTEQQQNPQSDKQAQSNYEKGLALGVAITFGLHTIFGSIILWLLYDSNDLEPLPWIMFIGVTQLTYLIPVIGIAYFSRKSHIVKGLLIGVAVTFLLNAACTGLFFVNTKLSQL
jgi:ABC-type Fe3+-siderophore transport system permease subunit